MPSPLRDLLDRRVPQWTAVYLGVGWGLVQFVAFLEERYLISPHWTDLCLLTIGLLLPSVVLYTYNHGRPGADRIQRSEKVGIPANVIGALVVLWFVFGNKDLGAMTTPVTVTGENGETIERELAKPEHRRRVAVFPFETPGVGDTAWAGVAANLALQFDLSQDSWLDLRSTPQFVERLREAGYDSRQPIPLALKREISDELNLTHFTAGTIRQDDRGYRLEVALYDVDRGHEIARRSYAGADPLALVDSASYQMRRDLDLPLAHVDEVEDLPVAERLTSNAAALRAYARGLRAEYENRWTDAVGQFDAAVELDPTFAAAAMGLFQARLYTSDQPGAIRALDIASDHIYRLPERMQFYVRANRYQMQQQLDRAVGVLEMAAQLYPDAIEPRVTLAMLLPQMHRERDAIARLDEVLRIDPGQVDRLLTMGDLYRELGDYDSAIAVYERFDDAAPRRTDGLRSIAEVEALRGNHDAARSSLERALLLDARDVDVLITLADVAQDVGDFDDARRQLDAAESAARTPEARYRVDEARAGLARRLGQPLATHDRLLESVASAAEFTPPLIVAIYRLRALKPLAEAGRADDARRRLAAIEPDITGIFSEVSALGALSIEVGTPDPDADRIDAAADRVEHFIESSDWEILRPTLLDARGLAAELRGDYGAAVEMYRRELELDPSGISTHTRLARALRLNGDPTAAARELEHILRPRPADAAAHYELAMVHEQEGRPEEAVTELRRALDIWKDAEPAYAPAARAREALDRLLAAQPAGER